jgi:hypothetical protein
LRTLHGSTRFVSPRWKPSQRVKPRRSGNPRRYRGKRDCVSTRSASPVWASSVIAEAGSCDRRAFDVSPPSSP